MSRAARLETMTGERIFAGILGLLGLGWLAHSLSYRYWSDFAPGSGFLPFWLGLLLVILVGLFLLTSRRSAQSEPSTSLRRPAAIIAGLAVCIALIDWVGFVIAVAAYLVWLIGVIERRPIAETAGVGIGAPVILYLIFRVGLKVPLPAGPWGF
jgi:putative tricarboxylic transport membrane protein